MSHRAMVPPLHRGVLQGDPDVTMRVCVERGGHLESEHRVHAVVCDGEGRTVTVHGDQERMTWMRSTMKPFQALPLVEDGVLEALGINEEELAVICASHSGEPRHVELVGSILRKAGLSEEALECGAHPPMGPVAARGLARSGRDPRRIHNNCSGKHAGMLALSVHHGWATEGYREGSHPVQQRMLKEVSRWTGCPTEEIGTAVDGCGVLCFALPLRAAARGLLDFVAEGTRGGTPGRVAAAMVGYPVLTAGTGRLCSELMEATAGRILVKVGAEGVYVAASTDGRLGLALKVEDGARRGAEAALLALLEEHDLLSPAEAGSLGRYSAPAVRNTLGEVVGRVRVRSHTPES